MKITVIGLGYVGLANSVLLAQHNQVIGVDISNERVDTLNARRSPIVDTEISKYLAEKNLDLTASTDLVASVKDSDYVLISTPTHFDEKNNTFDTSSVEKVIIQVYENEPSACMVVKSTIPIGFIDDVKQRLRIHNVIFSPEFLREGTALHDNLYPSRIIVGEKSTRAETFARLMSDAAIADNINIIFTGSREAEAIKLFSNTYLAMRVAFFNELDNYALTAEMNTRQIIEAVSADPRIGKHYNNPSFGYGGYCLPKDTKQLLGDYGNTPQSIIQAIVESNQKRKSFLADQIIKAKPKTVGVYRIEMKVGSDNSRESSILDILETIASSGITVVVYAKEMRDKNLFNYITETNFTKFKSQVDIIITNRYFNDLDDVSEKVFTRDVFGTD